MDDVFAIIGNLLRQERPWTDKRHIPAQHVEKLGQFVKAVTAQKAPQRRHPWILRKFKITLPILFE
ncbi:MAG: hypothetical protein FD119_822 [Stygiobacter sp.]|nr:MAG: hypothetical protein FD119_822 [Stygiobacter sp.]